MNNPCLVPMQRLLMHNHNLSKIVGGFKIVDVFYFSVNRELMDIGVCFIPGLNILSRIRNTIEGTANGIVSLLR